MATRALIPVLVAICTVSACTLTRAPPFVPTPGTPQTPAGPAQPAPGTAAPAPAGATAAPSQRPNTAPPKQFRLGGASSALVAQAHTQAAGGDFGQAAATLERALRIEPDNPLLWIELGRVRLDNPAQADAMGRKALALATGDPAAQSSAWHLIADALRAEGRNVEAAEAEQQAQGMAAR